jgi:hypothetical protein
MNSVGKVQSYWVLKQVAHIVSTVFWSVNSTNMTTMQTYKVKATPTPHNGGGGGGRNCSWIILRFFERHLQCSKWGNPRSIWFGIRSRDLKNQSENLWANSLVLNEKIHITSSLWNVDKECSDKSIWISTVFLKLIEYGIVSSVLYVRRTLELLTA